MVHTLHVIKRLQLKDGITGLIFVIDKDMAQVFVIPDESDDSDEDESLQYSVNMTPADHAILHSKQWLNDKVQYENISL